jgi:hypothetical protein
MKFLELDADNARVVWLPWYHIVPFEYAVAKRWRQCYARSGFDRSAWIYLGIAETLRRFFLAAGPAVVLL